MTEPAKDLSGQIHPEQVFFLSEILKNNALCQGKKIGQLRDVIIIDHGKIAEVTHLYISRPFGDPALVIPWEKIIAISKKEVVFSIEKFADYEKEPSPETIFFKDYVLDKKVLDIEGREVEIVYDARMVIKNNRLIITGVDLSRYGMLRRLGLKGVANFLHNLAFKLGAQSLYSEHLKGLANFIYGLANKVKDRTLSWAYVQALPEQIDGFQGNVRLNILKERLSEIPAVDMADILETLDHDQRVVIFDKLEAAHAADTLEEIDPNVQRALAFSLRKEKTAKLISLMTPGQAADFLSVLPFDEARAILKLVEKNKAAKVQMILEKQEQKIINFATQEFLRFPPEKTAKEVLDEYSHLAKGKDIVLYLYVIDASDKLLGIVALTELLQADDNTLLKDIMNEQAIRLNPQSTLKEAAALFSRYGYRAIPITDENDKILGIVPYRDVMNLKHRFV